jgi:hypothetical protein
MTTARSLFLAAAVSAAAGACAATAPGAPPPPGEYRIVGGKVDRGTFTGWRLFHSSCHGCHGVGGVGTGLAPDLVERVRTMTPRDFADRVLTNYGLLARLPGDDRSAASRAALLDEVMRRERGSRGQMVVMPAWEDHARVQPHVLDLYAYLLARADGQLGPGKPAPLPPPAPRRAR